MAMNKLVWIDDSYVGMKNVVRGTFPLLWREGIISRVVFLGDFDDRAPQINPEEFRRFVSACFSDFNIACQRESVDTPKVDPTVLSTINDDIADNREALGKSLLYKAQNESSTLLAINEWKSLTESTEWDKKDENGKPVALKQELSIASIISGMSIPDNAVCALDIVLLKGDEDKLNCNAANCKPIISMEIYHEIVKNHKCLLYSRYTSEQQLRDNWKMLYTKRYGAEPEEIRPREGLYKGSINKATLKMIIDHCKEEQ